MKKQKFNWIEIQSYYDLGHSERECKTHFGVSVGSLDHAKKTGKFSSRKRSEAINLYIKIHGRKKHTQKTKEKISKIRSDFLIKNPNKVPYLLNHSSKESYPENLFRIQLEKWFPKSKYYWVQEYQHGIYSYDFAFPDIKLDIEIDGSSHKTKKVLLKDKRRDKFSVANGWTVIRFDAEHVKKNINECIFLVLYIVARLK